MADKYKEFFFDVDLVRCMSKNEIAIIKAQSKRCRNAKDIEEANLRFELLFSYLINCGYGKRSYIRGGNFVSFMAEFRRLYGED